MIDYRKLKALRAYNGYTQEQVEDSTGIKRRTLSGKERGEAPFSLIECMEMAKLYKMTAQDFNEIFLGGALIEYKGVN